jgi:hypothetical protein
MSADHTPVRRVSDFVGTLIDLLDRVEYRRVDPRHLSDPVYRLRYEAYRREEFIPMNSSGLVRDEFEDLANAHCYGIYIDGALVSSLRFHYLDRDNPVSPSQSVFPDVLNPLIEAGETMIDPGRFTADFEASLAYPALPFLTLRIAVMATYHFNVRHCLATVRPEHVAFYRRVFNSTELAAARYYHGLRFPMVLYSCNVPVVYPRLLERYAFFGSTVEERAALFDPVREGRIPLIRPSVREAIGEAAALGEPA